VLDVSGSMEGHKLELVKHAMVFLIDNLGSGDRLSVVAFSDDGRRVIRLTRMSEDGKAAAKRAVESLTSSGSTNIRDGLDVAAMVLDGRRHKNAVASVILLSDGQDNQSRQHAGFRPYNRFNTANTYDVLVPPSIRPTAGSDDRCAPVHTFGFGTDHDAAAMHFISEVTGGTFSFIENHAVIQDVFAQCIGGLLSVAVQKARISLECLHPGVRVREVKSGSYESRIDATVDVGELYADEERRFLLFVDVPWAYSIDEVATRLFKVRCTYLDTATGQSVDVAGEDAVVLRPLEAAEVAPSMEVERERVRVCGGHGSGAGRSRARRLRRGRAHPRRPPGSAEPVGAAPALSGDPLCKALVAELRRLSQRVSDEREYRERGRACFLAGMRSQARALSPNPTWTPRWTATSVKKLKQRGMGQECSTDKDYGPKNSLLELMDLSETRAQVDDHPCI